MLLLPRGMNSNYRKENVTEFWRKHMNVSFMNSLISINIVSLLLDFIISQNFLFMKQIFKNILS